MYQSDTTQQASIKDLKNRLPSILSCTVLKRESSTSLAGPCVKCGGKDRQVYKEDSQKIWCRKCHPEPMDVIDFHCWLYGKSVKDLFREYFPEHQTESKPAPRKEPAQDQNPAIQKRWDDLLTHVNDKPAHDFLSGKRKIAKETVKNLHDAGQIRFENYAGKTSVAVSFKTMNGNTVAIQNFSVDGEPFPFTEKNGKPANKIHRKGSKPGLDCFFMCGADISTAKTLIITESVINAITAYEWFPDACCIALGGSTYTDKVKALKPYIDQDHVEKVIVAVDNDSASEKMLRAIWDVLGNKVHSFNWDRNDPQGYDINDLLQAGQTDRGINLIQNAEPVWYEIEKPDQDTTDAPEAGFQFIHISDLEIRPPDWLLKHLIEKDSLVVIFGDPASGKSFAGIDIACCVSTGKDFHGIAVCQGAVLYIAGEGQNGLKRRFTAWQIRHQVSLNKHPLYISTAPASFCNATSAKQVEQAISAVNVTPALVVVDTLARNFGPGDENSTQDMSAFISALDEIRAQYRCTILLIHHTGHGDKSRGRGAMALKGALDAEYRMDKDDMGVVRVENTKMKEFEKSEPMAFKINTVELGITDEDGEPVTSAVLDSTGYEAPVKKSRAGRGKWQTVALKAFESLYTEHQTRLEKTGYDPSAARVLVTDWRNRCYDSGMSKQTWGNCKKSLTEQGLITVAHNYVTGGSCGG